ncbi:GSCFA domain-containing protein [Algoriphagus sediminis]|uniref:GSCFA domain-containing protein n=1 Tax=Algoriphagus sediminis TaxID=3057113 RepID=A0ABT7Y9P5_9BACT|nr:GSCFA domain-containing protein [Algoriphagus sediminis]MDN3203232.1 GSCFA domain-containing protein [Algoriphagus sediminis]
MNWHDTFPISESNSPISYDSGILCLGSCFAEVMGSKLFERKFNALVNPFGTIFNPITLSKTLLNALENTPPSEEDLISEADLILSFEHHSTIRAKTQKEIIELIQSKNQELKSFLQDASHLILTFGTAWVYEKKKTRNIVANCHKQAADLFDKRLLTIHEMTQSLEACISKIKSINPEIHIILTVSPVRHTKDGIPENQLSKSLLRVLCEELTHKFPNSLYFPAYEIMMDELRDYRFYKQDRIHPSEEAEDYIWSRWTAACMSKSTCKKMAEIEKINLELAHKPFNPETDRHQQFLKNLLQKMERLNSEFDFSQEINLVKNQIHF